MSSIMNVKSEYERVALKDPELESESESETEMEMTEASQKRSNLVKIIAGSTVGALLLLAVVLLMMKISSGTNNTEVESSAIVNSTVSKAEEQHPIADTKEFEAEVTYKPDTIETDIEPRDVEEFVSGGAEELMTWVQNGEATAEEALTYTARIVNYWQNSKRVRVAVKTSAVALAAAGVLYAVDKMEFVDVDGAAQSWVATITGFLGSAWTFAQRKMASLRDGLPSMPEMPNLREYVPNMPEMPDFGEHFGAWNKKFSAAWQKFWNPEQFAQEELARKLHEEAVEAAKNSISCRYFGYRCSP